MNIRDAHISCLVVEGEEEIEVIPYRMSFTDAVEITNKGFRFLKVLVSEQDLAVAGLDESALVFRTSLESVLGIYNWNRGDLRQICVAHEVGFPGRANGEALLTLLNAHECGELCSGHACLYVFRALTRGQRPLVSVSEDRTRSSADDDFSYLDPPDQALRHDIIREWQSLMSTDALTRMVCAVCARMVQKSQVLLLPASDIDLLLLRNDHVPREALPVSYNVEAYSGAILHPDGMRDHEVLGDLQICRECHHDLEGGVLPKFALANFLYYGHDRVPDAARRAFAEASIFERMLVSRARASKISFRFCQASGRECRDQRRVGAQRYMKGNVIVHPQDAPELCNVLPLDLSAIRDTICVVFVGATAPSQETIEKLSPVLVRKSRVRSMIEFLVANNPHYEPGWSFKGFSQDRLDALFGPDRVHEDQGVPCSVKIEFLPDNEGVRAATSDHTGRDEMPTNGEEPDALLMENVGFTMGDGETEGYRLMKLRALAHCRTGRRYVRAQAGSQYIPDFENPQLLSWLFPHLDPWGIGGFHHPQRERRLSMLEQLKYLLSVCDSPFQRDPNFAFVYYNILQKKKVCELVNFRVPGRRHQQIVERMMKVDPDTLSSLIYRFDKDSNYVPETAEEKDVMNLMSQISLTGHDLPGTAAYKVSMRNQIRGLINFMGTPTVFVTMTPADIHHPLVRFFSGDQISLEDICDDAIALDAWSRRVLVAENPSACALFFHTMITHFIQVVLRYGSKSKGLLGKCNAFYGTVETQGRGTLHIHMLIWLEGHLSPQALRDKMATSEEFTKKMFRWLEAVIKCEPMGTVDVLPDPKDERGEPIQPERAPDDGQSHPTVVPGPLLKDFADPDEFEDAYCRHVNALVQEYNWHKHTDSCYKYLRRGEKRGDATCRMRMNGTTRETTTVDEETGSILLRRLHARTAAYNDLIIFLIKANMDISFIGSGEAAKAILYYTTDYITKPSLTTHAGLAALSSAIRKISDRYPDVSEQDLWTFSKGALNITVNSMMSKLEIPHQMVLAYLIGGGDRYVSHRFRVLHWKIFDRMFEACFPDEPGHEEEDEGMGLDDGDVEVSVRDPFSAFRPDPDEMWETDDKITLTLGHGSISATSQKMDYLLRPVHEAFEGMCLYEFVGKVEKMRRSKEQQRLEKSGNGISRRGRNAQPRGLFSSRVHPQFKTHMLRRRTAWLVPVLLGKRTPRKDRELDEKRMWARMMLILFVPWRLPRDLKRDEEDWLDAFKRQKHLIKRPHRRIIRNMNVLSECRDARDEQSARRRQSRRESEENSNPPDVGDSEEHLGPSPAVGFDLFGDAAALSGAGQPEGISISTLDETIGPRARASLDACFVGVQSGEMQAESRVDEKTAELVGTLKREAKEMLAQKRKHRSVQDDIASEPARKRVRYTCDTEAAVTIETLKARERDTHCDDGVYVDIAGPMSVASAIARVIQEFGLLDNAEQLQAFEMVGNHLSHGTFPLQMYIGGVGGTGKTHVIRAIQRLFRLTGKTTELVVGAPTGAAAVLIGGYTVHAMCFMSQFKPKDVTELRAFWDKIRYCIIDEVSMLGALLMSEISRRLQEAKAEHPAQAGLPFGGVHMIFTGDFGQLPPVRQCTLYNYHLVRHPMIQDATNQKGISSLHGVYLWRGVKWAVKLVRNQRQQTDARYAELLGRVREGKMTGVARYGSARYPMTGVSDLQVLRGRVMACLAPVELAKFVDCPIIVGTKYVRDALNNHLLRRHAARLGVEVHLYHSVDNCSRKRLCGANMKATWNVGSSQSNDALGRLPLFVGMKVMVQENLAFNCKIVNGAEGTVDRIVFDVDDSGRRYASVVYVRIPGAGQVCGGLEVDVAPIFPKASKSFPTTLMVNGVAETRRVSRRQVPIIPAYSYTDYKSQGRSLECAIVDLESAQSLQGVYVMLSRVKSLSGLAVLRSFNTGKMYNDGIGHALREELQRIDALSDQTRQFWSGGSEPLVSM